MMSTHGRALLCASALLSALATLTPAAVADPAVGFIVHARLPTDGPPCPSEPGITISGTYLANDGASTSWDVLFAGRTLLPQNCPGAVEACEAVGDVDSGLTGRSCTFGWSLSGISHGTGADARSVTLTLSSGSASYTVDATMVILTAPVPVSHFVHVTLKAAPQGPHVVAAGGVSAWLVDPSVVTIFNSQPGVAGCMLAVPDPGADGVVDGLAVMAEAVRKGCVTGYVANGCFVEEIDGLGTGGYWMEYTNNVAAGGLCDAFEEGDSMGWVHHGIL